MGGGELLGGSIPAEPFAGSAIAGLAVQGDLAPVEFCSGGPAGRQGNGLAGGYPAAGIIQTEIIEVRYQFLQGGVPADCVFVAIDIGFRIRIPGLVYKYKDEQELVVAGIALCAGFHFDPKLASAVQFYVSPMAHMRIQHIAAGQPHRAHLGRGPFILHAEIFIDGGGLVGHLRREFSGEPAHGHQFRVFVHHFYMDSLLRPVHIAWTDIPLGICRIEREYLGRLTGLLNRVGILLQRQGLL